jgi:hypothetical protein
MQSADPKMMLEALRRKKAQGVDLTIIIGDPEDAPGAEGPGMLGAMGTDDMEPDDGGDDPEDQALGLAPQAPEVGADREMKAAALGKAGATMGDEPGPGRDSDIEAELMKSQLLGPNSLFGRKMAAKKKV